MPKIDVKTEQDTPRGWTFIVAVGDGGRTSEHHVTLSWSDYDHWSRGRVAPQRVAAAVVAYAMEHGGAGALDEKFDCARVRRRWPQIDRELTGRL